MWPGFRLLEQSTHTLSSRDPQVSHPNQVVCRYCKSEVPVDLAYSPVPSLAEEAYRFEPPKDLFDAFAHFLTRCVATVPGGPTIDS